MASVKVAVRVRPFNERELNLDSKCIIKMESNKTIILNQKATDLCLLSDTSAITTSTSNLLNTQSNSMLSVNQIPHTPIGQQSREKLKEFAYDASYWSVDRKDPNFVSQLDIYNDLGKLTLNSAFDGYNACVCAYGQTGSGKSYTMMGDTRSSEQEGLIPRICKNLFEKISSKLNLSDKNNQTISYRTEVSYLEIYNEKVRDLLRSSSSQEKAQNLKVREHPKTGVYVQDLSQHTVSNYEDIQELINRGNLNRTTASTNMNDVSSRSHAIFTIKFSQAKIVDNIPSETVSKINLVDLAGSERADSTGATGIRLKEGGNINKSLLTFINVISTLADLTSSSSQDGHHQQPQKKHYIPYRDSVLTWLLKDSLGGNSKTIILAAISPADVNYVETLSTLRYANRAKNIINKPTINEDPNVKLIRELRAEIVKLKLMLDSSSSLSRPMVNNFDDEDEEIQREKHSGQNEKNSDDFILKQIDLNQNKIEELTNKWKCKWQKYHSIFDEYENISIVKNQNNGLSLHTNSAPYLICFDTFDHRNDMINNLNSETINLNCLSIYPLKEGINVINGPIINEEETCTTNFTENSDITYIYLSGKNVHINHCYLNSVLSTNKVYVKPVSADIQLNDIELQAENTIDEIELKTNDFLIIADHIFQFKNPTQNFSSYDDDHYHESNDILDLKSRITFLDLFKQFLLNRNTKSEDSCSQNEKLKNFELLVEEQRTQIQNMNEQIEFNNTEMSKLKELSLRLSSSVIDQEQSNENILDNQINPLACSASEITLKGAEKQQEMISKELDERETMQNLVEKFEREEKLLTECMKDLNKSQQNQLKSLLFELQNLRLKEQDLDNDLRRSKSDIELSIENLNMKRDLKLSDLNKAREKILQNKDLIDLKLKMTQLTHLEMELGEKVSETKSSLNENQSELERLNTQLSIKKMYNDGGQSLNEMIEAEDENINRARQELEKVKCLKNENYLLIEKEFELAREQMIYEFENCSNILKLKNEISDMSDKETKLKQFLLNCLYENDEEKCLVENELTELVELKECLEEQLDELRAKNRDSVGKQMEQEYNGLSELKSQDLEEIRQDEERLSLLYESSTKYLIDSIQTVNEQTLLKKNDLKALNTQADIQSKKMDKLLSELEVMENKRLIEENKIFLKELQIANEIKNEFEKLTNQLNKLDSFYGRKLDNNSIKKENLKPKLCALVGNYKGMQLFDADFNPKIPISQPQGQDTSSRSNSVSLYTELSKPQIDLFVDPTHKDSISGRSLTSSISSDTAVRTIRKEQQEPMFFTNLCKSLGINVDINESFLFGKKSWDEHYEYLIEIRVNQEHWFIFRRYSKIRQLHEQMCLLYPSLNRLVFPMRLLFNGMDKQKLLERQLQLEHYLKCFMEILLSDPTCPIYFGAVYDKTGSSSNIIMSNSISMSSLNSSIYSSPSSASQNSNFSNLNLNLNHVVNRAKLCSFCPFFDQTQQDLVYLGKLSLNRVSYRNFSGSFVS